MTEEERKINQLLNKEFVSPSKLPCWDLCRAIYGILGKPIPENISALKKIYAPQVGCVVLIKQGRNWHAGIVWPDTLHFIHCRVPLYEPNKLPVVRIDKLNDMLYELYIDGYYA